ncbi:hypothetical protein T492DRAFT_1141008 [Pavlovales sp. CCMP2436]|nr:hypothetical protein T492DRAFT_1141008 [Pavlovales sp. CCMP2436]
MFAGGDMWRVSYQYTREQLLALRPRAPPAEAEWGGAGGAHGSAGGMRAAGWEYSSDVEGSKWCVDGSRWFAPTFDEQAAGGGISSSSDDDDDDVGEREPLAAAAPRTPPRAAGRAQSAAPLGWTSADLPLPPCRHFALPPALPPPPPGPPPPRPAQQQQQQVGGGGGEGGGGGIATPGTEPVLARSRSHTTPGLARTPSDAAGLPPALARSASSAPSLPPGLSPSASGFAGQFVHGSSASLSGLAGLGSNCEVHSLLHAGLCAYADEVQAGFQKQLQPRNRLIRKLGKHVRKLWPGSSLQVYGSCSAMLASAESDLDLVVCDWLPATMLQACKSAGASRALQAECVQQLAAELRADG